MTYRDAPDEIDDLFKLLIQTGHGIEVNTSVYDTFGFFLPDLDIIRRYKELGGEIITTGSDSHNAVRIAANFQPAMQMLKAAGFDYVCTFDKMKPIFHRIED